MANIHVTYDPALPFPQDAIFGRGITDESGNHTSPSGYESFNVDDATLAEGVDERFYQTTTADTLTLRSQAEIDAIRAADAQALQDAQDAEAQAQADWDALLPLIGTNRNASEINEALDQLISVVGQLR